MIEEQQCLFFDTLCWTCSVDEMPCVQLHLLHRGRLGLEKYSKSKLFGTWRTTSVDEVRLVDGDMGSTHSLSRDGA
jgi:hypothetical protein